MYVTHRNLNLIFLYLFIDLFRKDVSLLFRIKQFILYLNISIPFLKYRWTRALREHRPLSQGRSLPPYWPDSRHVLEFCLRLYSMSGKLLNPSYFCALSSAACLIEQNSVPSLSFVLYRSAKCICKPVEQKCGWLFNTWSARPLLEWVDLWQLLQLKTLMLRHGGSRVRPRKVATDLATGHWAFFHAFHVTHTYDVHCHCKTCVALFSTHLTKINTWILNDCTETNENIYLHSTQCIQGRKWKKICQVGSNKHEIFTWYTM